MVEELSFDSIFAAGAAGQALVSLKGKRVMVTGASSGIGRAAAILFAASGANLTLVARRADRLEALAADLRKAADIKVDVLVGSVCDDALYEEADRRGLMDGVDILINNAGLARGKDTISEASLSDWSEMLDANCKGAFRIVQSVLPSMKTRRSGHIIATGSIAGIEPYETGSVYCASKHALHAFNKVLRLETYQFGIRVTTVAPGLVADGTEFSEVRFHGDREKASATYTGMKALNAQDVAKQIVWVAQQPEHVNVDMLHVMPTCQGSATKIHRS